jgi:hypothetical protein
MRMLEDTGGSSDQLLQVIKQPEKSGENKIVAKGGKSNLIYGGAKANPRKSVAAHS